MRDVASTTSARSRSAAGNRLKFLETAALASRGSDLFWQNGKHATPHAPFDASSANHGEIQQAEPRGPAVLHFAKGRGLALLPAPIGAGHRPPGGWPGEVESMPASAATTFDVPLHRVEVRGRPAEPGAGLRILGDDETDARALQHSAVVLEEHAARLHQTGHMVAARLVELEAIPAGSRSSDERRCDCSSTKGLSRPSSCTAASDTQVLSSRAEHSV